MASDIHYTMLFVDQGMGNLISVTDAGQKVVKYTALIDFGTTRSGSVGETLQFLIAYVEANRTAGKKPDFDLLVVSHQDEDHWNLLPTLLAHYAAKAPISIGMLAYGGNRDNYKPDALANLKALEAIAAKTAQIPITEKSAYAKIDPLKPLGQYPDNSPDVLFKPVICNATMTGTIANPSNMQLNTVSLMVGVIAGGKCVFLLPGDATAETVNALKTLSSDAGEIASSPVLSVPHHGSHKSIADNYNAAADKRVFTLATWFAGFVKPQTIAASAGFHSIFKHPHDTVLTLFRTASLKAGMTNHNYVAYQTGKNRYVATPTTDAIFTNYISLKVDATAKTQMTGAVAKRWVFTYSGGAITVAELAPNAAPQPGLAS